MARNAAKHPTVHGTVPEPGLSGPNVLRLRNPELKRWDLGWSLSEMPSSEVRIIPLLQMRKLRLSEIGTYFRALIQKAGILSCWFPPPLLTWETTQHHQRKCGAVISEKRVNSEPGNLALVLALVNPSSDLGKVTVLFLCFSFLLGSPPILADTGPLLLRGAFKMWRGDPRMWGLLTYFCPLLHRGQSQREEKRAPTLRKPGGRGSR